MISNSNNEEKDILVEKIKDYFLIGFFILFVACIVIFMQYSETLIHQNQETSTISTSAKSIDITPYVVTDLTGTTWIINDNINASAGYDSFLINYTDGTNISHSSLYVGFTWPSRPPYDAPIPSNGSLCSGNLTIFAQSGSFDLSYNPFTFIDGTDVTNSSLITWLQANATQIQSGYSSTINLTNCTCNRTSETGLSGSFSASITANTGYVLTNVTTTLGTVTYSNDNKVATISISDVNDDFTITASATLIYHNIVYNLGNVVVTSNKPMLIDENSTITITFQPYNNYVLPQYINVDGVTSYQWNYESGVLSLTNSFDNVQITINAEYKSGQYTFVELIDSVTLVPVNTFFNLFDFEIFGVNIYSLLLSSLVLFVIIKVVLKVFK